MGDRPPQGGVLRVGQERRFGPETDAHFAAECGVDGEGQHVGLCAAYAEPLMMGACKPDVISLHPAAQQVDARTSDEFGHAQVDRLVIITEREVFSNGAVLKAEAYFERQLPAPEVQLAWPSLAERLRAAGYRDGDPALQNAPEFKELKKQVELGQVRLPDVRRLVQISADFPRWQLRWQFFEDRGRAEMTMHGNQIMGLQ